MRRISAAEGGLTCQKVLQREPLHKNALNNLSALLFETGQFKQAETLFKKLIKFYPDFPEAYKNYGYFLLESNEIQLGVSHLLKAIALDPKYAEAYYTLATAYIENDPQSALTPLEKCVLLSPGHIDAHANLARVLDALGYKEKAMEHGAAALELKSRQSFQHPLFSQNQKVNIVNAVRPFDNTHPSRNIISFSLWEDIRTYTQGALENAMLAKEIYPGWRCRFYYDTSVPINVINKLASLDAEMIRMPVSTHPHMKTFWRFLVINDVKIDRFLCRDCDARLNTQEQAAVEEWLNSEKPFHIMRDTIFHTELMLAGLWGGVANLLPNMKRAIALFEENPLTRWVDQDFLRFFIWPLIKDHVLTHDSFYRFNQAKPFPQKGRLKPPLHVGAGFKL